MYYLNDPEPFKAAIGVALFLMSVHLIVQVTPWYLRRTVRQREFKEKFDQIKRERIQAGKAPSGLPDDFKITTVEKSITKVTIRYWDGGGTAPADVDVTVARGGVATVRKVSDTIYDVWGIGLS